MAYLGFLSVSPLGDGKYLDLPCGPSSDLFYATKGEKGVMCFPKCEEPGLRSARAQPREPPRNVQSLGSSPGALGPATACHLLPELHSTVTELFPDAPAQLQPHTSTLRGTAFQGP